MNGFSQFARDLIFLALKAGALAGLDIAQSLEILEEQLEYIRQQAGPTNDEN
jgi:hypothetical protein